MKWYDSLIKKIRNHGKNIFLYDLDGLLEDINFLRTLSLDYDIFRYEKDYFFNIRLTILRLTQSAQLPP